MGRKSPGKPKFKHLWYLQEWMKLAGKAPIDLHKELGWAKAKASDVYTGKQPYSQAIIDEVAPWLHAEPHELLMSVDNAMGLRQMRAAARMIAGEPEEHEQQPPEQIKGAA